MKISFQAAIALMKSANGIFGMNYVDPKSPDFEIEENNLHIRFNYRSLVFSQHKNQEVELKGSTLTMTDFNDVDWPLVLLFEDKYLAEKAKIIQEKLSYES